MMKIEDPEVYCNRCLRPGAVAYRGWQLLCPHCIRADEGEYWDDKE